MSTKLERRVRVLEIAEEYRYENDRRELESKRESKIFNDGFYVGVGISSLFIVLVSVFLSIIEVV